MAGLFSFIGPGKRRIDELKFAANLEGDWKERPRSMSRRIVAAVILALVMVASAAMVSRASKLHAQSRIGTMETAGD
jgi:hypothetical protein